MASKYGAAMRDISTNTDPTALIAKARDGDRTAVNRLLELYWPYLKLLARLHFNRQLNTKIDASDLIQETSLLAGRDIEKFRGATEKEFVAWLRRIMANVAVTQIRFHTRQVRDLRVERRLREELDGSSIMIENAMVSADSTPSQKVERRERAVILAEALGKLPEDYREVLILREFEGLSTSEIALRLDKTTDSVHNLCARGILKLQSLMRQYDL